MSCVRTDNRVAATDEPRTALVRQDATRPARCAGAAVLAIVLLAAACGSSGGAGRAVDRRLSTRPRRRRRRLRHRPPRGHRPSRPPRPVRRRPPSSARRGRAAADDDLRDAGLDGDRCRHHEPGSTTFVAAPRASHGQDVADHRLRDPERRPASPFRHPTSRLVAEPARRQRGPRRRSRTAGAPPSSTVEGRYAFEIPTETGSTTSSSASRIRAASRRSTCRSVEAHPHPRRTPPSTSTGPWRSACPGSTCDGPSTT
jgi:hypothetical protein